MTYRVRYYNPQAVSGVSWRDMTLPKKSLPKGSVYLCPVDTELPHPETTLYLASVAKRSGLRRGRKEAGATPYVYACDLKPYLEYLDWFRVSWAEADYGLLSDYVQVIADKAHRFTGETLDPNTMTRLVLTVLRAYDWSNEQSLTDVEFDRDEVLADLTDGLGPDAPSQGHGPRQIRRRQVRAISDADLSLIVAALGPLPSKAVGPVFVPTRNRLVSMLALTTGMRACEISGLTPEMFPTFEFADADLDGWTCIHLTETKGMVARNAFVANRIVKEIGLYCAQERRLAVEAGVKRGNPPTRTLFVNGADAGADAGRPLLPGTISGFFRAAVREAGLVTVVRIRCDGDERDYLLARYCFHDLRHSFAIRLYNKLLAAGRYPWDIIQARLGHRKDTTTKQAYGNLATTVEPLAADLIAAGMDALIHG